MKSYVAFGDHAVMVEHSYDNAKYYLHKYFHGNRHVDDAAATDHRWKIIPLNRAIPSFLKPGKIYFSSKLAVNN